jgi:hypothetical protein
MMIFSIILTLFCIGSIYLAKNRKGFSISYSEISKSMRESIKDPLDLSNILLLLFFLSFLILPFSWGLTFYLRTDANVLVVLLGMVWIYNWIKYVFQLGT